MKKSGISLIKMSIYNMCIVVFLAILMIIGFYLSANGATPAENQEIKAETISSEELEELEEPIEDEDIENTNIDKPNEAIENQIPSENEDDNIDIQEDVNGYWEKDSQGWHFYNSEGIIQKGFCIINSKQYYFSSDGVMRSGWQYIDGNWYYFGEANDGSAKKDWEYIGGSWYYFEPNYVMVSDTIKEIRGSKYAFSASGAMLLGKFTFNRKTYVTDVNGSLIPYDDSVEAKAREIASELGYNIYRALNYCAGMSRYYLTSNGRTSYPIMSSSEYAIYGYKNYGGDCLVMASAFKYLAQACGYYCTQWFGWVGSSTHSWCEIDGYVYDPNFINATNRGKYGFAYGTRGTWRYSKSYTM